MVLSLPGSSYAQSNPNLLYEKIPLDETSKKIQIDERSSENFAWIQFDYSILEKMEDRTIRELSIQGLDDQFYNIVIENIIQSENGGWSAVGLVGGEPMNTFVLSYSPSTEKVIASANIRSNHTYLSIRYNTLENSHLLIEEDLHQSDKLSCKVDDRFVVGDTSEDASSTLQYSAPSKNQETSVIDVMIVYTPNAEDWANTFSSGIDNIINQSMAVAQVAADNSEIDIDFRLVHSRQVSYNESGNSVLDLQRLTASPVFNPWGEETSGFMDEVHQWRDIYGADLVALFTETSDVGGIAWVITATSGLPHYAFSISNIKQAAGRTHAHEMGHNFGNAHSRNQNQNPANDGNGRGIFPYSTGWRWTGNDGRSYASVMTYLEGSDEVLVFSNPDVLHEGVPTGSYEGEFAPADNARSMREVQYVVEQYRSEDTELDFPAVTSATVSNISYSHATVTAEATFDGGSVINAKGFCWSTDSNPGFSDQCTDVGSGLGPFDAQITNLDQNSQYYVRSFATNSLGSTFGEQQVFTTRKLASPTAMDASGVDAVSFTATWTPVEDADRYLLDVSTNQQFTTYLSGFESRDVGNASSFSIDQLTPGTEYFYRVRTGAETTESAPSNTKAVSTIDVSADHSKINTSRDKVLATGVQESLVQIKVVSSQGEPVRGVNVRLNQGNGSSIISPSQQITGDDGGAVFSITNSTEEVVRYNVYAAGLNLSEKFEIEFLFSEGELTLGNNYPNPFNNQTLIPIVVPQQSRVRLDIYNSMGTLVQTPLDEEFNVGYYEIPFNASGLASGLYFYRMVTNQGVRVEKMLLAK